MEEITAEQFSQKLLDTGNQILKAISVDAYKRWNDLALKWMEFILGPSEDRVLHFRFPVREQVQLQGDTPESKRIARITNNLSVKLAILEDIQESLKVGAIRIPSEWEFKAKKFLAELENLFDSTPSSG